MSSATMNTAEAPPVLSRLLRGTFWLALKTPASVVIALWSTPLTIAYIGVVSNGDYKFAWGFGFIQLVLEFGMGSALQKQMVDVYSRGDRDAVNRTIACGMNFYAVIAVVQIVVLVGMVHGGLPAKYQANPLVIGLLWVQILTTPFYGISAVVGSVLQAARRYEFIPRLELAIILLRFGLLWVGYKTGAPFLLVVVGQVAIQIGLSLAPALVVMRKLDHWPHFGGVRRSDFAMMMNISIYLALLQWSVVLADKVDYAVLGYALTGTESETSFWITVYDNVSKPFFQIRQASWTLAYLVMPAVVSLAVAGDKRGLDQIKYDGTRYVVALLTPVTLLAGIYAATFLDLWVGPRFVPYAWMLQLFLVATIPFALQVIGQMALGMGFLKIPALAAMAGSLVNLPVSYFLTRRFGVSGVIWGTVLTTLLSNLLIPGAYWFRVLKVHYSTFLTRTLSAPLAGALALIPACWLFRLIVPPEPIGSGFVGRLAPFLLNLSVGSLAYLAGYCAVPTGRADLAILTRKLARRRELSQNR